MKQSGSNLPRKFFLAGDGDSRPWTATVFNALVALLFLSLVVTLSFQQLTTRVGWMAVGSYWRLFLNGWLITIFIAALALMLSLTIGVLVALCRKSPVLLLRDLGRIYVEAIRGTPLLAQIYILYYGIFHQAGVENRYVAGALILSIFSGAYIGEIIRAGIDGIAKSQIDSARGIGLTTPQIYRYVIFPQAMRRVMPPLAGQFASIIKDSSLLSIIGLNEFTQNASNVNSNTFSSLESYFPLAIGYLVLTLPISFWTQSLEKKFKFET